MLIKNHMKRLIETYPQINDWDVYNEPIGPFKPHIPPSSIRDWINYKGGIYPAMVEIYNYVNSVSSSKNYSNNHYHAKDPEFFKINKFFIDQGLNYSSIGMQAHMQSEDNVMSEEQLWNQIEDYAILGKNIQFTEITVTSSKRFKNWKDHQVFLKKRDSIIKNGGEYDLPSLPSFEDFQSDYLKDFYTLAFSHPSVSSITIWNLTDQNAWRGHAGGVLFKDLTEKKSFLTLENLIKNRWSTKITKELNLNNEFSFRGFYGLYECELDIDGKVHKFEFNFNKEDKVVMIDI
jgi:GH35 family endo-1,4-beta-xylanase